MQPTTIDLDTELSAVNSILGSIGQSPVTTLEFENPEISFVYQLLSECNRDVQNEGWVFNREDHYPLKPDADNEITFPANILRLDVWDNAFDRTTNVIKRDGKLYDKYRHSFKFEKPIEADIVWLFPFEDLPPVFKRYITYKASGRAATQLVANKELVTLLAAQEVQARAACVEYECNQGDYTMLGNPDGTAYRSYQPYRGLQRW